MRSTRRSLLCLVLLTVALWLPVGAEASTPSPSTAGEIVAETAVSYDAYGLVDSLETPTGASIDYGFNLAGAHESVLYTSPSGVAEPALEISGWNQAGSPLAQEYGTGDDAAFSWDALGRLSSLELDLGGSLPAYRASSMRYDAWGFLESATRFDRLFIAPLDFRYGYTDQGQLERFEMGPNRTATYHYDAAGNLERRVGFGYGSLTLPSLAPTSYDTANQRQGWLYDDAGRLVEDDEHRYHYDVAGRLVLLTRADDDDLVAHYQYDANGHRVRTFEIGPDGDRITYHFRDGGGTIVSEEVHDGAHELIETRDHVLADGQSILTASHAADGAEDLEYRFNDRLGNPVVRWDAATGAPEYQEYSPYGHPMRQAAFEAGAHGFAGHDDDATGLTYMRARYYDPASARFLQPDPAKDFNLALPSSHNLYHYTYGNPVNAVDPTGEAIPLLAAVHSGASAVADGIERVQTYMIRRDLYGEEDANQYAQEQLTDFAIEKGVDLALGAAGKAADLGKSTWRGIKGLFGKRKAAPFSKPSQCFAAGTLVRTPLGLQPIEELQLGDLVLSRNDESGLLSARAITQLFVRHDQAITEVTLGSEAGLEETYETTSEHPFWVRDIGWVPAARLEAGDLIATDTSAWLEVRSIRGPPGRQTVYNFEVAEDHTYFVGELGAWVHNTCLVEGPLPQDSARELNRVMKGEDRPNIKKPKEFANDGRYGSAVLPRTDAAGNPIRYTEHYVNPGSKQRFEETGFRHDKKRIVTGSDGSVYATEDHYKSFFNGSGKVDKD